MRVPEPCVSVQDEPRMAASPAIELLELTKHYAGTVALEGVSLAVERGEIFGYLGQNGAGKTTTIKVLTGLIRPTSGDARVAGHSVVDRPLEVKARIGYVPDSGAIYEKLTPREHLETAGLLYGLSDARIHERTDALLELFALEDRANQRMDTFSKGMKQKVCLAAAMIHEPETIFLDEPMNGLDVESVRLMKDLISRLASGGTTIFYTSHLVDLVEKICTRVGVLHGGRLLLVGSVDEVLARTDTRSLEAALVRLWSVEGEPKRRGVSPSEARR